MRKKYLITLKTPSGFLKMDSRRWRITRFEVEPITPIQTPRKTNPSKKRK